MGYTIKLLDENDNVVQVARHTEGGTYVLGGTTDAEISITYNYSKHFRETIDEDDGIRWLYGKKADESVPRLHGAIRALGTVQDDDYWLATPGNVGAALHILLVWAREHEDAVFVGD